jgi:hypothetical protein
LSFLKNNFGEFMTRKRMTAQSKANIPAAKSASLLPTTDGYKVLLEGENGTFTVQDGSGDAVYSSMASAKKAVRTHNPALAVKLKPTI